MLIEKGICDKGFIWNPSNYYCECDKSCDIREYLDYKNCEWRKKVVDSLVEKCSKYLDKNEMVYNKTFNVSVGDYKCGSIHSIICCNFSNRHNNW